MIAFLGGTGPEGRGLALRYALAGERTVLGSRDQNKAEEIAKSLMDLVPDMSVQGAENRMAARQADMVFLTVPYQAQRLLLAEVENELAGKVVVSVVAPLVVEKGLARAVVVEEGSAAMEAQMLLPKSRVVAAFQNLSATDLLISDRVIQGDVIVCSDHFDSKTLVMDMVGKIKDLRSIDGGGLENAGYVENLTALLLNINRIYKAHSTVRILGV